MPTHDAEAIVLRHYSLGEADRIVVFFSREFGKIRAVGAGAKKTSSRLAGALEPLNHLRIQFYGREGSELYHIRQCEIVHAYLGRNPVPERFYAFSYFAEAISEFVQENNASPQVFRLLLATLDASEKNGISEALVRYFEVWLLKLNGLLPDYAYCSNCGECVKGNEFFASAHAGLALCSRCAKGRGYRIGPETSALIGEIMVRRPDAFASRPLGNPIAHELETLTQLLLVTNLERRLKSYQGLKQILKNGLR